MDSSYLLVMNAGEETAEALNSALRNSGIVVHILQSDSADECARLLRDHRPVLVIHPGDGEAGIPLGRAAELAGRFDVPLAIRYEPGAAEVLLQAQEHADCFAFRSDRDEGLAALVERLARAGEASGHRAHMAGEADELRRRHELLLDSIDEPVAYLHEGLHTHANRAYLAALGLGDSESLHGLSLLEAMQGSGFDLKVLLRDVGQGRVPETPPRVTVLPKSGQPFEAALDFRPVRFDGEECLQLVLRRNDEHAQLQAALAQARQVDPVTGLLGRAAFAGRVDERLSEAGRRATALFCIQPDGDGDLTRLSLQEQDELARGVAQSLNSKMREHDLAARIADFAFCAFVERESREELKGLGEQLQSTVAHACSAFPALRRAPKYRVGFVTLGPGTGSAEDAVRQAREAWTHAAKQDAETLRYRPTIAASAEHPGDANWVERIRFALDNDDFYSVQHEIVHLEGEGEGLFENRTYLHQDGGDVGPEEFLAAAERHELASTIDRSVIPGLLRAASGAGDRHIINLSCNSIQDFSFPSWLTRQVSACEVEGSQLVLQLPLEAIVADPKAAGRLLEETAPLGCGISIAGMDDSDTALDWLQEFKPTLVKLKAELVDGLKANPGHQAVVRSVVGAAEACGSGVIADQVADSRDMAVLWQCGVKLVGGDFLQEPPRVIGQ